RYLIYDVNPGEGFNLRRDVYLRVANLVKFLNEEQPWVLVLPPWGHLYHWQSRTISNSQIPWAKFFDLASLRKLIPVMEFTDYLKVTGKPEVESAIYLQRYKEGWSGGHWEEKMHERECLDKHGFVQDDDGLWRWWFWGYKDAYAIDFKCMSVQAQYTFLKPYLLHNTTARSVLLLRAEHLIHGSYSEWSPVWWTARRSMVFSQKLRDVADQFREAELNSDDVKDNTVLEDWPEMKRIHGDAIGGPYMAVHLRRKDFLSSHTKDVPSLAGAAKQIREKLKEFDLNAVYVATDAPKEEFLELQSHLSEFKVVKFEPTQEQLDDYKDGGVAIIDQWICAHARFFMGTGVSTFTFRIHEEREILGFDQKMTFNRFCGDNIAECEQPTKWSIKYE
ncbi:hypothetical protein CAPTEDRAFT_128307, partial [Capitella teleta]